MKTRIAIAALVAALSQTALAGDAYWENVDNGFDNAIHALNDNNRPYWENVQASFHNLLNHEPYAGPTAISVARQMDHSVDRLIFALRQGQAWSTDLAAAEPPQLVRAGD